MSDMNIRTLLGRGRELLGRMRLAEAPEQHPPGTFSLLALRLDRDLKKQAGRGHSILVTATDDDTVGVEATVELAWSLAEELGHSVLVVDGAFSARALSASLGLADKSGLAELLDAPEDGPTLAATVQPTLHERIAVLPHGNETGDGAIRGEAIQRILAAACERYDFVLVQGSILVEGTRSMAFSSLVDAALLIAVEEKTTMDQITRGQRLLNDCGARRVALVLANRPQPRRPVPVR